MRYQREEDVRHTDNSGTDPTNVEGGFAMRKPSRLVAAAVCLASVLSVSAAADEIWIAPGEKADVTHGDWGVTSVGEAHFTFTVPDSVDSFTGAQVMVIGKKNKTISYDLHLSISHDGAFHYAFNTDATGLSASISTDKLSALDASSVFTTLNVGAGDIVGLHFEASSQTDLRVIGLRFQFTRVPDQAGLTCGADEFLVGFDAAGAPICDDRSRLLANLACDPGEFVTGFDSAGDLVCSPVVTGGGGDDDILIEINDVEIAEGDSGTTPMVFTVSLSAPSASTITVDFSTMTIPGGASPGTDFVATTGTVTFDPGEVTQPVTVEIVGDVTVETTEEFLVVLDDPSGATIGDGEGRGRIFDNDNDGRD